MVARIKTVAFQGVQVTEVDVQVQIASGVVYFGVVGLPDKAVGESRERVRAAIHALGLALPARRILINLAPADLLKEGSHFDLPIAIALLVAMGVLPQDELEGHVALGELALDGAILPVAGVLPAAIAATAQGRGLICPAACGTEAAWSGNREILAAPSLLALINHFKGVQVLSAPICEAEEAAAPGPDLREVRGQETARRALEIAAAGGHNLLMSGPPGAGKSLLAACLPGILPPLDPEEILETSMIASIAGKLEGGKLSRKRPFRDPHHSSSMAAMVGGGRHALPGEVSLAHRGVLFLDELPEFQRPVLESLRQPLEAGKITVARANAHYTYPATFQLVAAMNPCRCGYVSDPSRACSRVPRCAEEYQSRLSGPLLDRIDLLIDVPEVKVREMMDRGEGEPSAAVAARVAAARERQRERYQALGLAARTNAELSGDVLRAAAAVDADGQKLIAEAAERLRLSMRGLTRVLRVARTIADLEGSERVSRGHLAEALAYRQLNYSRQLETA